MIGSKRISTLKKSDIKKYYNYLVDERNLKPSTIDNIHTVLHQVLQIAVDDDFIRNNPSDNVLRELKKAHCFQSEKRRALTKPEQELFLNFLKTHPVYEHWYPVFAAMGEGTIVPDELIPRCPHCGAEMFPWVRGYGNFLQGKKYEEEYEKISKYIQKNKDRKILFIELGVGRMTPMFIQEPFWELTNSLKDAYYISVNSEYQFLPEFIEDKGIAILGDIGTVLKDLRKAKEESAFVC